MPMFITKESRLGLALTVILCDLGILAATILTAANRNLAPGMIEMLHNVGAGLMVASVLVLLGLSMYLIFSEVTSMDLEAAMLTVKKGEDRAAKVAEQTTLVVYSFKELSLWEKTKQIGGFVLALFCLVMALAVGSGIMPYPPLKDGAPFIMTRWGFVLQASLGVIITGGFSWMMRIKSVHKLEKARLELTREMNI